MQYDLLGGGHVTAATPLDLVEALRQDSQAWAPTVGIEDFMDEYARRCALQTGAVVRTDDLLHFLYDLMRHGFLVPPPAALRAPFSAAEYGGRYLELALYDHLPRGWVVLTRCVSEFSCVEVRGRTGAGHDDLKFDISIHFQDFLEISWPLLAEKVAGRLLDKIAPYQRPATG